jgi:hypothetical protein
VIGRSPANYKLKTNGIKVVWHVDVDLGQVKKVSRQHALIIFNFDRESFELKCLSRKYPVFVNRMPLTFADPAVAIQSGTLIAVGAETFFFMLPSRIGQEVN